MHLPQALRKALPLALLVAANGVATTIVSSTGNGGAVLPLGYYAPYAATGNTPIVAAVEWTQTTGYQDVNVAATLFIAGGGDTLNYTLTNAIGPGTSFAANGITRGSVSFNNPNNAIQSVDLFQLPHLGPGTYFLTLDSLTPNSGWSYGYPLQPSYTTDTGVTFVSTLNAAGAGINSAYTAASSFSGINLPLEFAVTGTAAPVPEPGTFTEAGLALVAFSFSIRRVLARSGGGGEIRITRE